MSEEPSDHSMVLTRDGRNVRIIGTEPRAIKGGQLIVYVEGDNYPSFRFLDGKEAQQAEHHSDVMIYQSEKGK